MELTRENISLYCQIGTLLDDICEKYFDKVADDTWQFYSDWGVFESMIDWIREKYKEQGPKKLGEDYKDI